MSDAPQPLQFESFTSAVDTTFWHALSSHKLDVQRLDSAALPLNGTYGPGRVVDATDGAGNTAATPLHARLSVFGGAAFDSAPPEEPDSDVVRVTGARPRWTPLEFDAPGVLYNTNTQEEFKTLDKNALLKEAGNKLWRTIIDAPWTILRNPSKLSPFIMLTHADLKRFKYYFWFGFPALLPATQYTVTSSSLAKDVWPTEDLKDLRSQFLEHRRRTSHGDTAFFIVRRRVSDRHAGSNIAVGHLGDWEAFSTSLTSGDELMLAFVDPSALSTNPGWPLRNLLVFAQKVWRLSSAKVLCFRDLYDRTDLAASIILDIQMPEELTDACPEVSGWERNSKGQLGPRVADLGSVMDPTRLMDSAVDLNLKLMRWRALPDLNLEKISSMRCLLLGAGTLGCYAARTLMGWGIRAITFVDSGQVSYSNPARQPLFEFADAKEKRDKAIAAASALKRIYPGMQAEGVVLSIPMPGHSVSDEAKAAKDLETLEGLVDSHDAIFLLTDSRESRWLGTVLGRAKGKIVINAALGFDTYLVMRHGVESSRSEATTVGDGQTPGSDLGCYYCNDVVAPSDSLNDRTLDQQCTVTRPGVAGLAGALAGELLAQIVGHPLGPLAPASPDGKDDAGPLGPVPHQIRGFLGRNNSMSIVGKRFGECIGCSDAIVGAYREQGWTFVRQALEDPTYLEELTGLAELKRRTDEVEIEDWDERSTAESADDDF